jgi:hypothetical protein
MTVPDVTRRTAGDRRKNPTRLKLDIISPSFGA